MKKWFILCVLYLVVESDKELATASSSEPRVPMTSMEEFFTKNQIISVDTADDDIKEILINPNFLRDLENLPLHARENSKRDWNKSIEDLFRDINLLLDEPSLESAMIILQLELRKGKKTRFQGTFLQNFTRDMVAKCTIFINPISIRVGSLSSETGDDLWPLGQMISYKEFALYHELIHFLYWLRAYKEIMEGVPEVDRIYNIFDSQKYRDYFWRLWEEGDFREKWQDLEEQIVVIGLPLELPPDKQKYAPLGKYSEAKMRQAIGIAARYPYANANNIGERLLHPITHENSTIIHQVFADWEPAQLRDAIRPDWRPF